MTLRLVAGGQTSRRAFALLDAVLDRSGRRQLEGLVSLVEAGRGHVLAKEGELGRAFLAVSEGMVKLWKALPDSRRQIVAFRAPGELVTLHRRHTPWPVTAETVSASKLHRIEWDDLRRLADRYPAMDRALFEQSCDEIASLQNRVLMLGRKTTEEKLASFILEFCRPSAPLSSLSREIDLPMRRPEIAEYLGLTTESVSREFSRFKQEHIIAMPRPSRIVVLNQPALEALALGVFSLTQPEVGPDALAPLGGSD